MDNKDILLSLVLKVKDILNNNEDNSFSFDIGKLDEVYKNVSNNDYSSNIDLFLDFIKLCVDCGVITKNEALKYNFYILKKSLVLTENKEDIISLVSENSVVASIVGTKLSEIFNKYGYVYNEEKFQFLNDDFVSAFDPNYLDYVLSKFKEYNVSDEELYKRKDSLYKILVDKDKGTFDSIIDFVSKNKCSLYTLLGVSSVIIVDRDGVNEEVATHTDFLNNYKLYKKMYNKLSFNDEDIVNLDKFLCTPNELVRTNLNLLYNYSIIEKNKFPSDISLLSVPNLGYNIDRFVELGFYEAALMMRTDNGIDYVESEFLSCLGWENSKVKFYKLKRASVYEEDIVGDDGKIRDVFTDDSKTYRGITCTDNHNGEEEIMLSLLSQEEMDSIDPALKQRVPNFIMRSIKEREPDKDTDVINFEQMFVYRLYNLFSTYSIDDERMLKISELIGKLDKVTLEPKDFKELSNDYFVDMLDNMVQANTSEIEDILNYDMTDLAVFSDREKVVKKVADKIVRNNLHDFCDYTPIKYSDFEYVFVNSYFPKGLVVVSRIKVLRICKLLRQEKCWINKNMTEYELVITLLAVLVHDSILSELDLAMMMSCVRELISSANTKKRSR